MPITENISTIPEESTHKAAKIYDNICDITKKPIYDTTDEADDSSTIGGEPVDTSIEKRDCNTFRGVFHDEIQAYNNYKNNKGPMCPNSERLYNNYYLDK